MAPRKGAFPVPVLTGFIPRLAAAVSAPVVISQSGSADSSRKLSDLFNGRNESELVTDLEDMSRTPTTTSESAAQGGESVDVRETETPEVPSGGSSTLETPALDKAPFGEPRPHPSRHHS
jgi:hypothetical protein